MNMLRDSSITSLAGRIATGELRAVEVAEAALARIASLDEQLGAFLSVTADDALAAARAVDRARDEGAALGKLAGVPIAVKDALCMKGVPTTCASRILEGYILSLIHISEPTRPY